MKTKIIYLAILAFTVLDGCNYKLINKNNLLEIEINAQVIVSDTTPIIIKGNTELIKSLIINVDSVIIKTK